MRYITAKKLVMTKYFLVLSSLLTVFLSAAALPLAGGGVVSAAPAAPSCTLSDKTKCVKCPDGKTTVDAASDCPVTCNQNGKVVDCGQVTDEAVNGGNCADLNKCDLVSQYLNPAVNFLAALAGLAVTIAIIWGGIEYASSGGDAQKVQIAKNRIRNAIIALLVFFFLWTGLNFLIPGGIF